MQTLLDTAHCRLTLYRYPRQSQDPLQAWDAADEYLISHLAESQQAPDGPVIIMNDGFGALAGYLHAHAPVCVTDSHISEAGHPGQSGGKRAGSHAITLQDALAPARCPRPGGDQGLQVSGAAGAATACPARGRHPATRIIAAGKAKDIHTSTLKLFEKYLGRPAPHSPGRRHASFIAPRPPSARP